MIYIICEGETEEKYFSDYKTHFLQKPISDLVTLVKIKKAKDSCPKSLLTEASECLDASEFKDNVFAWLVFDTEEKIKNENRFLKAKEIFNSNKKGKIKLAISNPSFELWLLSHFIEICSKHDSIKKIKNDLKKNCSYKDCSKQQNFNLFKSSISDAMERCKKRISHSNKNKEVFEKPSTTVHFLVESIQEFDPFK